MRRDEEEDKSVWIRLHKDIIRQITTKVSLDPPATHSIRSYMQYESGCQDCRYRTDSRGFHQQGLLHDSSRDRRGGLQRPCGGLLSGRPASVRVLGRNQIA